MPTNPDHYAVVYTEDWRRIFVIISDVYGNFVLTKKCSGPECGCIGCVLLDGIVIAAEQEYLILDTENAQEVGPGLVAHPFTEMGALFMRGLKLEKYKGYKGSITKEALDEKFHTPSALLIVKTEKDGTFTHSYLSPTVDRVISKGCKSGNCPCIGCKIVDMLYAVSEEEIVPTIDRTKARANAVGDLILPIFQGEEIISKLLNCDPSIRHRFTPNTFDSPLERIFYELAFLDLHIYPQHKVGRYRLDFAIPDKKIAIEIDGHEYHKKKYQRTHDAQRDRWLFGQGWNVLRFTGTEINMNVSKCVSEVCALASIPQLSKCES
jgi:very-short-patch-repair endonuclease